MALTESFHLVFVNRDVTPDVTRRFNVSAYPSLAVLGPQDENVHRFSGFKKPDAFRAELEEGLRRYGMFRRGEAWDTPAPRPARIADVESIEIIPAPSEEIPSGITWLDGEIQVFQGNTLFALRPEDGSARVRHEFPFSVRDLCTDGTLLYGVEYGWTAGGPIHVIDPATGTVQRRIVTAANAKNRYSAGAGIAFAEGKLYVLEVSGKIHELDPRTGVVRRTMQTSQRYVGGLAFDGQHLVTGSRDGLHLLDPDSGAVVRTLATAYPLRAVGVAAGRYLLMEQPVFGFGREHERIRVWPQQTKIYSLALPR